jgi:succinyl-CoA synthetase beta subunit
MPRKKITELKAKQIVLGQAETIPVAGKKYVIKVDQGIKKRGKLGLLKLGVEPSQIEAAKAELAAKGFTNFILEEFLPHTADSERYLSLVLTREGWLLMYSKKGGVDIEDNQADIRKVTIPVGQAGGAEQVAKLQGVAAELGVSVDFITHLVKTAEENYFSFLEINPLVVEDGKDPVILDMAVELDSAGKYFAQGRWTEMDYAAPPEGNISQEEERVAALAAKSQASLTLKLLNPEGSIWMLLSGGGASIVLADEVYNQGFGKQLANYGEYSGNPKTSETYEYTKNVISLLLKSSATSKVLIIAGGVANFTDVRKTFTGVIQALNEYKQELKSQGVKVYVRRGGPFEKEGLKLMEDFLHSAGLYGFVTGPSLPITEIVGKALADLHSKN